MTGTHKMWKKAVVTKITFSLDNYYIYEVTYVVGPNSAEYTRVFQVIKSRWYEVVGF